MRIKNVCSKERVTRNACLRWSGSCCRWFWLARAISGRSQHDRVRRGAEIGSTASSWFENAVFDVSVGLSQVRLNRASSVE